MGLNGQDTYSLSGDLIPHTDICGYFYQNSPTFADRGLTAPSFADMSAKRGCFVTSFLIYSIEPFCIYRNDESIKHSMRI